MKKLISNKLRSQRGASLILALLFLLLCGMVGASVLAAASSNAGRMKSNRTEQQEYFIVSSALQLVCDRITDEKLQYRPQADVTEETKTGTVEESESTPAAPEAEEAEESSSAPETYTYIETTYAQKQGKFGKFPESGGTSESAVTPEGDSILGVGLLNLDKELDYLFRGTFSECNAYHGQGEFQDDNVCIHAELSDDKVKEPAEHSLIIKVKDAPPDDAVKAFKEEAVKVTLRLEKDGAQKYWLFLTARLKDGSGSFVMKAELKPTGSLPHINNKGTYNGEYKGDTSADRYDNKLKWKLERIYKE